MENKEEKVNKPYLHNLFNEERQKKLINWYNNLDTNKGLRAELKRSSSPLEAMLCQATHSLKREFPYWPDKPEIIASIAGILALVKVDTGVNGISYATQLAKPKEGNKSPLSESRFKKIIKSQTWNEFYMNIRRSVEILKGQVNICSLADGIIQWGKKNKSDEVAIGSESLEFQWAQDYYNEFSKHNNN